MGTLLLPLGSRKGPRRDFVEECGGAGVTAGSMAGPPSRIYAQKHSAGKIPKKFWPQRKFPRQLKFPNFRNLTNELSKSLSSI